MFKRAQNTPVFMGDNWSYYYCCLLLFTRFILRISSNNKAIRPYRCGGRASANAKWDRRNGFLGLFFIGWFAGLLACRTTQTRTCLDYRLLSWLPDPMIDRLTIIEGPCSCSCSPWSSCTKHRPALISQHSDQGKGPWEENEDESSRTGQIRPGHVVFGFRLHAAVATCFVCLLLVLFFLLPVYRVCNYTLVYGMTRIMLHVLRIHLHTHACVHRYLDWTGN